MITIRTGALIKAIREQAAAKPAYVYQPTAVNEQCEYITFLDTLDVEPEPGCIVGAALIDMGIPVDAFRLSTGYTPINETSVGILLTTLNKVDGYATNAGEYPQDMEWLNTVQDYQDQGFTWSEAINKADNAMVGEEA
jgi:hypothetical protein